MQNRRLYLFLCLFCCAIFFALNGNESQGTSFFSEQMEQEASEQQPPITITLVAENSSVEIHEPFWLALRMELQENWHSYWKNPGEMGMPLSVEWTLPKGYTVTDFKWPTPQKLEKDGIIGFGYENEAVFLVQITPPQKNKHIEEKLSISGQARWLACSDSFCVPGESEISVHIPIGTKEIDHAKNTLFSQARQDLPVQAIFAAVKKSNGLIELEIEVSCDDKHVFSSAEFFPEHKKIINSQDGVLLTHQGNGKYHLLLKEHTSYQAKHLKGLVKLSSGQTTHKIEIDLPITFDSAEQVVAVTDKDVGENRTVDNNLVTLQMTDSEMEFEGGIGMALLFAFIGGALLNLMPCVLPVISFKILSFVKMAGQSRKETFKHGAAFSVGVIVSFWFFAGAMLLLQSYGKSVGWGFQLQEPAFVACLAALLFIFTLSLFGVFEIGVSVTGMAGNAEQSSSAKMSALCSSFCSGILATALATPCTGPFLGSAIGFAVTLPPLQALLIFTILGMGMAAPYLLLSAFPSLLRFLPKPGNWMVTFKEITGFVMLATILWLVWIFSAQTGSLATIFLLMSFLLFSIAAWVYGRYCTIISKKRTRIVGGFITTAIGSIACIVLMAATSPVLVTEDSVSLATAANETLSPSTRWQLFTPKRLEDIHNAKQPVFIDFTAKWCLICQANHLVLSTEEVQQKFSEKNIVTMKADWTKNDPEITKLLRKYGRNGVPLYLLFSGDPSKPPQVLPQVLTPESVIHAINNM